MRVLVFEIISSQTAKIYKVPREEKEIKKVKSHSKVFLENFYMVFQNKVSWKISSSQLFVWRKNTFHNSIHWHSCHIFLCLCILIYGDIQTCLIFLKCSYLSDVLQFLIKFCVIGRLFFLVNDIIQIEFNSVKICTNRSVQCWWSPRWNLYPCQWFYKDQQKSGIQTLTWIIGIVVCKIQLFSLSYSKLTQFMT